MSPRLKYILESLGISVNHRRNPHIGIHYRRTLLYFINRCRRSLSLSHM
jgi:hypothetical protein